MSSGDSLKVNAGSPSHELPDVDVELTKVKKRKSEPAKVTQNLENSQIRRKRKSKSKQ